ncbi:putative oxidoreductase [Cladochytrium replicatum]|nr:putative oxidoreductase [Cladochytrium replicatum]
MNFYVRLGKTGLKICVGCMGFGDPEWQESLPMMKASYDMGINYFDNGVSKQILGDALKKYSIPREAVVIATKAYGRVSSNTKELGWMPRASGLSRKHLFEACEASRKRLGTDYIDLYQIHRWDYTSAIEETMEALNDLVRAGKVRYIGVLSMYTWQFAKANSIADRSRWAKLVSMQNFHNLMYREEEREMNASCLDAGIGLIPWSPLAGGIRALKSMGSTARSASTTNTMMYSSLKAHDNEILKRLKERVALAWLLSKPGMTAPIFGISKVKYVEDAIAATHIKLSEQHIKYLEEPYEPRRLLVRDHQDILETKILTPAI